MRHCEYFTTGDQCKFCNFQSIQDDIRSLGVYRPTTINLDETVEAYKILASEVKLLEGRAEMGSFVSGETEGKLCLSFLERMASAASHKPVLNVRPQPIGRKEMQRLKDAGATASPCRWRYGIQACLKRYAPAKLRVEAT